MKPFMINYRIILGIIASLLPTARALYSTKDAVIQITPKNFRQEVLDTDHVVIAEFFAPWCGHCKAFAPAYKKAAEKLKGLAKVVAIDCDNQENQQICGQYGIKGFPTVKIFSGGVKGLPEDYNGPRTAKSLVDAAITKIPNYVFQIEGKGKHGITYEEFLSKEAGKLPRVILISKKSTTPPLYKALSTEYKDRLLFGEVKSSSGDIADKLNITDVPAIIIIAKDGRRITYEGQMKHAELTKFMSQHALSSKTSNTSKVKGTAPQQKEEVPAKPLEARTQFDFEAECTKKPGFCVLAFFTLEKEYEESVKAHEDNMALLETVAKEHPSFRYVWFNTVERGKELMRAFQLSDSLPAFMALNGQKRVYRPFTGAYDKEGLNEFLSEVAKAQGRFFRFEEPIVLEDSGRKSRDEL